jgi:hypothetical protein
MTKERPMRIGFYLVAGALFGAPAMLVNSAADAHPHHPHRLHAAHFVRPNVSEPPASHVIPTGTPKPEDHSASGSDDAFTKGSRNTGHHGQPGPTKTGTEGTPGGIKDAGAPAKETTPADVHMKDLGPVDTRISVVPRLRGVKPGRVRSAKTKFKVVPGHGLQVHPKLAPATVVRNAIGAPIHPQGNDNKGSQGKVPEQIGAGGTPKPAPGNGGTGIIGLGLRRQANGAGSPSPATVAMNHSSISGSIMLRPATAPAVIGGPAKNVVGALNGTTFRQRHP